MDFGFDSNPDLCYLLHILDYLHLRDIFLLPVAEALSTDFFLPVLNGSRSE
jgi:hypothetical protein